MKPEMMAMLRKRFGRRGDPGMDALDLEDGLPALNYTAETPGGGEVDVTRPPLVARVAASGVEDDHERPTLTDERGSITADLSGGITDDERATLNDPRASAAAVARRNNFDDMSNIFLSGGRAPIQQRPDPYKADREDMRDWVMKRGGVARGEQNAALNADRTGAYLAATKAQQERAAAAQALAAEREGRMADAEKARQEAERLKAERLKLESERDQANKDREFALKEKAEAKKKDKSKVGPKGAPKGFPAGWELEGNTTPTPKQGEEFEGLVFSSEKMKGMTSQMRDLLKEAGNSGRVMPGPMKSRIQQLATEIMIEGKNVADLGALSGPDMGLMKAIAADPTEATSFAKDMPGLLDGLGKWADNSVGAKAKSLGARRIAQAGAPKAAGGAISMKFPDGSVHDVTADKLELAKRKGAVPNG